MIFPHKDSIKGYKETQKLNIFTKQISSQTGKLH